MIADSEKKLQDLVSKLDGECRRMTFKININKTVAMGDTKARGILPVNI